MTVDMNSILNFGKHKGHQIEDLLEDDPHYLLYLAEHGIVDFDDEVYEKLEKL